MVDKHITGNGSDDFTAKSASERLACPCCGSRLSLRKTNGSPALEMSYTYACLLCCCHCQAADQVVLRDYEDGKHW